jgi:hypothetical protein
MSLYFPDPQASAVLPGVPPSRHAPGKMLRLDAEFFEACRQGDGEWLARHLADGFCGIATDGTSHGREAFVARCANTGHPDPCVVRDAAVQFEGDTAVVQCTIATAASSARVIDIWVGRDGRWQLLTSQRTAVTG